MKVGDDFVDEYPDGDGRATELVATLIRTGDSFYAEIGRAMLTSIGEPQTVLNALAVIEGAEEALTPSQVAERTFKSSGTMTATLDALEFHNWVRRVPNPGDRRSVLLQITEDGQAVCDRFLPGVRKVEIALVDGLTAPERTTLLKLLGKALHAAAAVNAADPIPLEGRRRKPKR